MCPAVTQQDSPLHLAGNAAVHLLAAGAPSLQLIMLMPASWGMTAHSSTPLPWQTAAQHLCLGPRFAAPPSPADGWWPLAVPMRWSKLSRPGTCCPAAGSCCPAAGSCCAAQSRRPAGTSSWLKSVSLPGWDWPAAPCWPAAASFWSPPATPCRHRVGDAETEMQHSACLLPASACSKEAHLLATSNSTV